MAPATMIQTPLRSGRTGDLGGNLARIDRELRRIRFPVAFDEDGAREGSPMALLPALHYAMLGFSRHVTRSLSDEGHDLQAKSDSRFVENAWKALRESFHYNPTLTPTQFLSPGFAERKLLLLADAIELCKRRHNEHARAARAADVKTVVAKEGGPRVARETRVKDTADGGRAEERKQRTPGRPIQIRRDPPEPAAAASSNAATLARGVANLRVSTEDNEPRTAENSDDDDDGDFEFRPSPSPARSRPPLADLAASGDAPPWFVRSAALRSQASSIAIDPTHDERDSFTVRESRESARDDERLEGPTESASDRRADTSNLPEHGERVEPATRLGSVRRSGGFPDENDPRTAGPLATPAVDHAPAIEALRVELAALVSRVASAEARAADAERRAAVAVDVANNAERRASAAEDAAADARKECDAIDQRVAAANAGLAEHGARAFLLEGRVRILEESARRSNDVADGDGDGNGGDGTKRPASEAPATNDDDEAPAIAPAAAPTPPRSPRASAGAIAAVEWPNVGDSPWAYRSPPNARSSVRDSNQSYFAPPTVAGVAAGVFADDDAASDWDATVNSSAEWGEASPIRSAVKGSRAGGVGAGRDARDAKAPGIDAGAFVDYYSKLLSTTEETLRKTKGAE